MSKADHFLFFTSDLSGDTITLDPLEARHATRVLRAENGDTLNFTDGRGNVASGTLSCDARGAAEVTIITRKAVTRPLPAVHLFVGLPERDAFESVVISATALGAASITPLEVDYCQKPWWKGSYEKYLHRFTQLAIVSLKQSQGCFLPEIRQPVSLTHALASCSGAGFFADIAGNALGSFFTQGDFPGSVELFIGPPGGFSPQEKSRFSEKNIRPVKLAHYRLRTEVAVTVFCAQVAGCSLQISGSLS